MYAILALFMLLLSGCVNVTTVPTLDDPTVTAKFVNEDCAYSAFGFFLGHADANVAKTTGWKIDRVRRIEIEDVQFLGFGYHCAMVMGDGLDAKKDEPKQPPDSPRL